jgi:hypothetical protein
MATTSIHSKEICLGQVFEQFESKFNHLTESNVTFFNVCELFSLNFRNQLAVCHYCCGANVTNTNLILLIIKNYVTKD